MSKVAIIVVTYNRKELLKENLDSLINQEYKDFDIFVIDNASTDGTKEYIEEFLKLENVSYFNTGKNLGGAGGFNYGIRKVAEQKEYEYCWVMDDDTIPTCFALKSLIDKANVLNNEFSFLCSLVKFNEDEICNMNIPKIHKDWLKSYSTINEDLIRIETCSFVSCFINMKYVYEVGLPIKEFFIYGDDIEYTLRLSKKEKSYIDLNSIVLHKMKNNTSTNILNVEKERINRAFYTYRNRYYINRKESLKSLVKFILRYFWTIIKILVKSKNYRLKRIWTITKGFVAGIFFNPKIEKINVLDEI